MGHLSVICVVSSVWPTYCELVHVNSNKTFQLNCSTALTIKEDKIRRFDKFFSNKEFKGRQLEQLSDFMLLKPFPSSRNSAVLFTGEMKRLIMSFYNLHVIGESFLCRQQVIKWPRFLAGLVPIDTLLYFCTISELCGLGY